MIPELLTSFLQAGGSHLSLFRQDLSRVLPETSLGKEIRCDSL